MKKILLIAALVAGAWYYFIGGRALDEQLVRDYYDSQAHALFSRDPELQCKLLHADFRGEDTVSVAGQRQVQSVDHDQACEAARETWKHVESIGDALGGMAQLDYNHEILDIRISDDAKTATVDTKYSLDIAGAVMQIRGTTTDTLVRRQGKVLMIGSQGKSRIIGGGGG